MLKKYESKEKITHNDVQQISLNFEEDTKSLVEEELKKINPLEMTPIDALNKLYELKNMLKK